MIKYGLSKTKSLPIYIDDAERGLKCNCICFECKQALIANKGEVNQKYFDHYLPSQCKGGKETAIHQMAKAIIASHSDILTPNGYVQYSNTELEKDLGFICPDVCIQNSSEQIFIEVFVTNRKKEKHVQLFRNNNLKCFEIDLSSVPYDTTPNLLLELVLHSKSNRKWLHCLEENTLTKDTEPQGFLGSIGYFIQRNPLLMFIISIVMLLGFFKLFFSQRRIIRRRLV